MTKIFYTTQITGDMIFIKIKKLMGFWGFGVLGFLVSIKIN